MKSALHLLFASLISVASAQLLAVPLHRQEGPRRVAHAPSAQAPLAMDPSSGLGPALPPDNGIDDGDSSSPAPCPHDPAPAPPGTGVILSDVMGRDRSINIFAGFTRDIETVALRLDDAAKNTTVLAPLNSAIVALPRKPWEDPEDYGQHGENAYEGEDGQQRAHRNLKRFTESHVLPVSPWLEGQKVRSLAEGDYEIWWEMKDGAMVVGFPCVR